MFLPTKAMPRTIEAPPSQVHWAKKYAAEISVGLGFFSIFFIILAIYLAVDKPSQKTSVTQPPVPQATPFATPVQSHKVRQAQAPVKAAAVTSTPTPQSQQRIIEQPQVSDVVFTSSTELNLSGFVTVKVYRIRNFNNMTAITFKVDSSANDRQGLMIACPISQNESLGSMTNAIDNTGRRYKFVANTTALPEHLECDKTMNYYSIEPHEVVYPTYLFEKIDSQTRTLDIKFVSFGPWVGYATPQIHVVI